MEFYKRAALVLKRVPKGKIVTYGQIALLCGKPGNSRQVGYGLGKNLMGKDIPAYKVVNSRGILSGAAAFETSDMQKILLEQEGVKVRLTEKGWKADLDQYQWKNTLEEAEVLREEFRKRGI